MKQFNIAIIGAGMIAQSHLKAIQQLEQARCVAVMDINEVAARSLADQAGCKHFTDASELLKACPELDLCILALPTFLHADYVELVARAGKAVLCEKPMEITVENALRIHRIVQETGILYMTAQVVRFWPGYVELKRLMDAGEFGDIHMAYFSRCSQPQYWGNKWLFDPVVGGGALHDMMVHDIDFMRYMFGPAEKAYALATKDHTGCYNNVFASITYQNGCKAVAETSFTMREGFPFTMSAKVMGSLCTVEYIYQAGFNINQRNEAHAELRIFRDHQPPVVTRPELYDPYAKQLSYFIDCLEQGKPADRIPVGESVEVIQTIHALEQSADTGTVVAILSQE